MRPHSGVREAVQHVYQYSVDSGTLEPAQNFVNAHTAGLPSPRSRHYAAITDPKQLGQLLRDIQAYTFEATYSRADASSLASRRLEQHQQIYKWVVAQDADKAYIAASAHLQLVQGQFFDRS